MKGEQEMAEQIRIGKKNDGTEVRVKDRKGGGADIIFVKGGEVVSIALTGNKRETDRVLHDVEFDKGGE